MIRTEARCLIAAGLLAAGDRWLTGTDLTASYYGRLQSGTVYPVLRRFHDAGWTTRITETGTAAKLGRPLRIYYRLTELGVDQCRELLRDRPDLLPS